MSHDIEVIEGNALAVFNRLPAWHRLGTVLTEPMNVDQAMDAAHLSNWDVRHAPLTALTDQGVIEVPDRAATIRTNPITGQPDVLGVTSQSYGIIQNEQAFEFAQNVMDTGGVTVEAAGSLNGGKRVWMLMHLPTEVKIGSDVIRPYLLVTTTHDATASLVVQATAIRVVCANTMAAALGERTAPRYSLRHTSMALSRVQQAREVLDLAWESTGALQVAAERWANVSVTDAQFRQITEDLFPLPKDATQTGKTRTENTRRSFRSVYLNTNQDGIRGTAYGVLNAAIEWSDFERWDKATAIQAATTAIGDSATAFKSRANRVISEVAGV